MSWDSNSMCVHHELLEGNKGVRNGSYRVKGVPFQCDDFRPLRKELEEELWEKPAGHRSNGEDGLLRVEM